MTDISAIGPKELTQHGKLSPIHPIYSTRMSPENTHKLMGLYKEVLILGVIL